MARQRPLTARRASLSRRAICGQILAFISVILVVGVGIVVCAGQPAGEQKRKRMPLNSVERTRVEGASDSDCRFTVTQGTPGVAAKYYLEIAGEAHLGLTKPQHLSTMTLGNILEYLGWSKLRPKDLEDEPASFFDALGSDAIATSWFSPKVSLAGDAYQPKIYGWRKLIRLRARAGSQADKHEVDAGYVLFNASAQKVNPPLLLRDYIQVMLTTRATTSGRYAAYWLVFRGRLQGWVITDHLRATFDGGDFATAVGPGRKFFVPESCAQCHGRDLASGLLNMLDTDHWLDRVQQGDDFTQIGGVGKVLLDAGNDPQSAQFRAAFDRIRTINHEIQAQNRLTGAPSFRTQALQQWLTLHSTDSSHRRLEERAFSTQPGAPTWTQAERDVLKDLNRYCYRCHSTIRFSVFDRASILADKDTMADMVASGCMPRDRVLDPSVAQSLEKRLRALQ
jgi:hypothetical protein